MWIDDVTTLREDQQGPVATGGSTVETNDSLIESIDISELRYDFRSSGRSVDFCLPCPRCGGHISPEAVDEIGIGIDEYPRLCRACIEVAMPGLSEVLNLLNALHALLANAPNRGLLWVVFAKILGEMDPRVSVIPRQRMTS